MNITQRNKKRDQTQETIHTFHTQNCRYVNSHIKNPDTVLLWNMSLF